MAIWRDLDHAFTAKLGESTDPKSIAGKILLHRKAFTELAPQHPQLRFLDTTNLDKKSMVNRMTSEILETFAGLSKA